MKVLVATHATQGTFAGDYCWTVDGELVTALGGRCDDPACGCDRGFAGYASRRATTTAVIAEMEVDEQLLTTTITGSLAEQGWLRWLSPDDADDLIGAHVDAMLEVCATWPIGTVVRRRGDLVWAADALVA